MWIGLDIELTAGPECCLVTVQLWKQQACGLPEANFEGASDDGIVAPVAEHADRIPGKESPAAARAFECQTGFARRGVAAEKESAAIERYARGVSEGEMTRGEERVY